MTTLNVGQASVDPVTGLSGNAWTAMYTNPNSNINPAYTPTPPTLAPSPGTLTAFELGVRKNLAAALESMATVMASFLSFGIGTIPSGSNTVFIADTAVNSGTTVAVTIQTSGAPPDTTCNRFTYTVSPAVGVTITANATPTATAGVVVTYMAINP